jgi:hypothetical protein
MQLTFGIVSGSVLLGQTAATGNDQVIGWFIVALLATMFIVFVVSLLRAKPTEYVPASNQDNERQPQKVEVENVIESSVSQIAAVEAEVESVASGSTETKSSSLAAKNKGLKGKKKQQKKKINSTRQQLAARVDTVESPLNMPVPALARASSVTNDLVASSTMTTRSVGEEIESLGVVERTVPAVETVAIVSTHTINAMANKPRLDAKSKPKPARPMDAKASGVQGFHKLDRYREPVRVFAADVSNSLSQSTVTGAATIGSTDEMRADENVASRKRQRGMSEAAKTVQEGPRTLKDFLSKKSTDA